MIGNRLRQISKMSNDPYDHKHRDSDRLQTVYEISTLLREAEAEGLDIDRLLPRVLKIAVEELSAFTGSIIITDESLRVTHYWLHENYFESEAEQVILRVSKDGLAGWTIRNSEPVIIPNTALDSRWLNLEPDPTSRGKWSAMCVPLLSRDRTIGAITLQSDGLDKYGPEDLNLLTIIANQAAVSLEYARLYAESRSRAEELTTLVTATLSVSTSLKIQEILAIVSEQMAAMLHADECSIWQIHSDGNPMTVWGGYFENHESGPLVKSLFPDCQRIINRFETLQYRSDSPDLNEDEQAWFENTGVKSVFLLPLMAQLNATGMVQLVDMHQSRDVGNHEIALVQTLSSQAAISIEHARLYERAQRQLQESALLNEAGNVINSTLDIQEIMQSLLAQANDLWLVEAISIALVDEQTNELVYQVAVGRGSEEIVGLRMPSNHGVGGWVMEHAEPALVPDTANDFRFQTAGDKRTGSHTRAMICTPLVAKGSVMGTIQAINPLEGTFDEADLQLLVKLANLASSAIANAQQFGETQAAQARYLGLFEDSIEPIILSDEQGNVVEANRQACEFVGYTRSKMRQLNLRDLHPPGAEFVTSSSLKSVTEEVKLFKSQAITSEKVPIPVEVYVKEIQSGDKRLLQWIFKDVTQQEELEKMREDLMAMLFHDLQSPLGNVISSLELMSHELSEADNPMAVAILDIATRSSQRLRTLIKSLLDINRLEAGHPVAQKRWVSTEEIVSVGYDHIQPSLERRNISFVRSAPPESPEVYVDKDMITRVLINLLDNAIKYSQDDDTLTIGVETNADDMVRISVADQGPGIPPSLRRMIFDKFFRVPGQTSRKGIGLGLAFCRLAIEAHGGLIWVDEAPGGGARFNFTIPRADSNAIDET